MVSVNVNTIEYELFGKRVVGTLQTNTQNMTSYKQSHKKKVSDDEQATSVSTLNWLMQSLLYTVKFAVKSAYNSHLYKLKAIKQNAAIIEIVQVIRWEIEN